MPVRSHVTNARISKSISRTASGLRTGLHAACLLMDLGRYMEGMWEDAPQPLLENIRELEA